MTNREKRREKIVRTPGLRPKLWVQILAVSTVLALFLMGMLAGAFSN